MMHNKELERIIKSAEASSNAWVPQFYETFCYTQPERNYIYRSAGSAQQKQIPLFTNAGKIGADIFVNRLQNALCPIGKDFVVFSAKKSSSTDLKNQLDAVASGLSEEVNKSKTEKQLDFVIHDALYDLIAGTGVIQSHNTRNGLQYEKCRLDQVLLGTERIQTVVRKFKMIARNIGITFPELFNRTIIGNFTITEQNQFDEVDLCDILYFNEETRKYEYYLRQGNETILTRTYTSSPYHILHWSRSSDMAFGAGIGTKAVPAIKRLNSYIRNKLELLPFAFPMFVTKMGNLFSNDVQFKPGGIIQTNGDPKDLIPLKMVQEVQSFQIEIATEEMEIKQTMLDYTLPSDPKQMTAAEVYARTNPQTEMVAGNVARLTQVIKDICWELAEEIFNKQLRGLVSFDFKFLKDNLDCNIINQTGTDNEIIQRINAYISNLQFDPTAIWQSLKRSETLEKLAKAYNLPSEIRNTAEEIEEQVQNDQQAVMDAQNAAAQAQMAIDNNKEQAIAEREIAKNQELGV